MQVIVVSLTLLAVSVYLCSSQGCQEGNGNYDAANQQAILDYHNNNLRSPIALGTFKAQEQLMSAATNMRKMKLGKCEFTFHIIVFPIWNCTLEKSAQDYANKCTFEHSGGDYGENLYLSSSTGQAPPIDGTGAEASASWADEFQTKGWPSILFTEESANAGIGHATQMAWWSSFTIGCGAAQCTIRDKPSVIVVCQYYPQGNMIGEDNYEAGDTCSYCGDGFTCETETGLCAQNAQQK